MKKIFLAALCFVVTMSSIAQDKKQYMFLEYGMGKTEYLLNSGLSLMSNVMETNFSDGFTQTLIFGYNFNERNFVKIKCAINSSNFQNQFHPVGVGVSEYLELKEIVALYYSEIALGLNYTIDRLSFRPSVGVGLMCVNNKLSLLNSIIKFEDVLNSYTLGSSFSLTLSYQVNKNLAFLSDWSIIASTPKNLSYDITELGLDNVIMNERNSIFMNSCVLGVRLSF